MTENFNNVYPKICRYCSYQERSHWQVRIKLAEFSLSQNDVEEIVTQLILDNFLNEERFVKAFVGGKFRINKWGRNKINQKLKLHRISPAGIKIGMQEIDDDQYYQTLFNLIEKKMNEVSGGNHLVKLNKVSNYVIGKGFEPELVYEIIKKWG